ncbi:hypothetical protein M413DRAFT_21276 [Hebeloma cylindrosporum]|uniref:Uncharacterized protein n=1 Tax=Hebeloma cylindrosporum TaxID=76867 RepID=A0A0C3CJS5_HEBCY|nr:hypothetical protein M413DRAFT_21276 [Hebeloma cylindrosporum h7]
MPLTALTAKESARPTPPAERQQDALIKVESVPRMSTGKVQHSIDQRTLALIQFFRLKMITSETSGFIARPFWMHYWVHMLFPPTPNARTVQKHSGAGSARIATLGLCFVMVAVTAIILILYFIAWKNGLAHFSSRQPSGKWESTYRYLILRTIQ